jgi:hypothetical protein
VLEVECYTHKDTQTLATYRCMLLVTLLAACDSAARMQHKAPSLRAGKQSRADNTAWKVIRRAARHRGEAPGMEGERRAAQGKLRVRAGAGPGRAAFVAQTGGHVGTATHLAGKNEFAHVCIKRADKSRTARGGLHVDKHVVEWASA